jgi:hypothetical protein
LEEIAMHIALIPCIVCAAVGAAGGWFMRDRDFYKSKDEQGADAKTASDAAQEEGD